MKKSMLLILTVATNIAIYAQSPVGKWKLSAVISESFSGKKTDMTKEMVTSDPCFAKVIYLFTADGKIDVAANGCTSTSEAEKPALWKMSGKTIKLYAGKDDTEPESFELEVAGNKMRWIKRFDPESAADRSTGIRLIVEEFTKQ